MTSPVMSTIMSILSAPMDLSLRLWDEIRRYQRKRETIERFFNALRGEIKTYSDLSEQISNESERFLGLLQSTGDSINRSQLNELAENIIDVPLLYSGLIASFIGFARGCEEVSKNQGFMSYLKEASPLLYDFVERMRDTYVDENTIRIDGSYYRFFQTYEKVILKDLRASHIEEAVREIRGYIQRLRPLVRNPSIVRRSTRRRIKKNYQTLFRMQKKIRLQKSDIDLKTYCPTKLLPLLVLAEEIPDIFSH